MYKLLCQNFYYRKYMLKKKNHNHDADQLCLDDQDDYREYGVDHNHDPDQWIQINTLIANDLNNEVC